MDAVLGSRREDQQENGGTRVQETWTRCCRRDKKTRRSSRGEENDLLDTSVLTLSITCHCLDAFCVKLQAQRRLELLLNAEESMSRMERLLLSRRADDQGLEGREKESAVVLERIANECARLTGQVFMLEEDCVNSRKTLGERLQVCILCIVDIGERGAGGLYMYVLGEDSINFTKRFRQRLRVSAVHNMHESAKLSGWMSFLRKIRRICEAWREHCRRAQHTS